MRSTKRDVLIAIALLALAGCGSRSKPPAPVADSAPAPKPTAVPSPSHAALRALNSDLSDSEAAWHLRAALNVAALSCDRQGKLGIASGYNQLLARQRKPLAVAYRDEGARFPAKGALDAHVTRLYNMFAQPAAQPGFCAAAARIAADARNVAPERFPSFAAQALGTLMRDLDERPAPAMRMAAATAGPPWRIQLGAYSGDRAARQAWDRISGRMKTAADFTPHYEDVPDSTLVRIRIGPVSDKGQAIALCAAAAGAGLDCLPVPPKA